jgi:transposase
VSGVETASREELLAIIAQQLAQIETLEARVAELEAENLRLRRGGGGGVELWVKPGRPPREQKERKRRGQAFVRRREEPEEVCHHALECCPDCGRQLSGGWEHRRRQVIELVLPRVRVVEHVVIARRCGVCGKRWLPRLGASEIGAAGKRRFGVSIQSVVATLHVACRIPMKMVRRLLRELWGLRLSAGEVVALLDGVAQAGRKELRRLHDEVRGSPVVCADETGWRQDGENGFLWTFVTPKVRYFLYRKSRSGEVAKEVLGEEFAGVTVSDFYAGYNRLEGKHQRCWVHLLRDLAELAELNADRPEVVAWVEAVRALYAEAKAFSPPKARARARGQRYFAEALARLARPFAKDPEAPQRVLAQRMLRFLSELFLFVADPAVPPDNNLAERSLRPAVTARKISGGTRSPKGSRTKMALLSLFSTWQAQDKPLLPTCQQLLHTTGGQVLTSP